MRKRYRIFYRHGLPHALQKTISEPFTAHLGGEITGRVGRMRKMRIGNLLNAVAHYPQETGGSFSTTHDRILGGGLFRKFTVVFDYSRRQMILNSNKNFSTFRHKAKTIHLF